MTTIQRKYSLPNCTLVLEGLSDRATDSQSFDGRPVLTILTYVECQLIQAKQTLTGGRDFFESLVTAVSGYAQEFLSHVTHPEAHLPVARRGDLLGEGGDGQLADEALQRHGYDVVVLDLGLPRLHGLELLRRLRARRDHPRRPRYQPARGGHPQ